MPIEIAPYDPTWPARFAAVAARLREALGERAIAIHHIGSTSVPGLAAKDLLDVQVTVADLAPSLEAALAPLGFEKRPPVADHCPPGMTLSPDALAKRMYKCHDPAVNLHVRVEGAFNQRYPLLFRDYLRGTPMAADAYGEIKRQLARYFPEDVDAYYDIKDPVCDVIMAGALAWAEKTGWSPAPTDA